MAIEYVQGTGLQSEGSVASLAKAFDSNVTAGNLILVGASTYNSDPNTVTDGLANSYTRDVIENASLRKTAIFSSPDITGGACTVTLNPVASTYLGVVISEFSGAATSSVLDDSATGRDTSTDIDTGNIVASDADIIFGVLSHASNSITITGDSPVDVIDIFSFGGDGNSIGTCGSYAIKTAATYTAGWLLSSSIAASACGAAYLPAVVGHDYLAAIIKNRNFDQLGRM